MPKNYTSTTFSEVYKDDYSDSAGYYKVLFNSGRPLQARELTQLQTILQTQIQRMANNLFLDGAAVEASGGGVQTAEYIVLEPFSGLDVQDYVGQILQGPATADTSGLQFHVLFAAEASDDGDDPTLYGTYRSANQSSVNQDLQPSAPVFAEGDILQDLRVLSGSSGNSDVTVKTQPGASSITSVGKGLLFSNRSASFYTQGHFVYAPQQITAVSKYDTTADVDVGFRIVQDIVTVDDTDELYDNQGAVPNVSSPGADRYRIRLELTTRNEVSDKYEFVFFAAIRDAQIAQIRGGSESYNQIEKRMAVRHSETHGNFIANPFDIRFEATDSVGHLDMIIPGDLNGATPTAFVDGYRLVNPLDTTIRVDKPTSTTSAEVQATPVAYRNYVNVEYDSAGDLGGWTSEYNLNEQTKMALLNAAGTVIGNGRIKHLVNTLDAAEGYRVHWYDVKMKSGQNARDIRSFRPYDVAGSGVSVSTVDGQLYAVEPEINTSFYQIPGGRVASAENVVFTVQRQYAVTSTAGSVVTITTGSGEEFDDEAQWIFVNTNTGAEEVVAPTAIGIAQTGAFQTANATVSGASQNYIVYAYVQKNAAAPKVKSYSRHGLVGAISATRVQDSGGDRFAFDLYDGISVVEARADSAAGRIITDQLTFDGGQRDNYYGPVVLKSDGLPSSVTDVFARFEYFTWGATGDYFSVNSYFLSDSFQYADIPTYVSDRNGETYDLKNQIDFRPKLDPYENTMVGADRFENPRDGDNITYDVEWYNRRIDHVALGYNPNDFTTEIRVNSGVEELEPSDPSPKVNEMTLFRVEYGGNTLDVKDLSVNRIRHKRFKMSDIAKLEDRVANLEETVSLSFLEQEAVNLIEFNSSGEVRSKTGFFVDDFQKQFALSGSTFEPTWVEDPNLQTQTIYSNDNFTKYAVGPKTARTAVQMLLDSDNAYTGRTGIVLGDMTRKGDLLYTDYREVLDSSLVNEVISWKSDGSTYEGSGYYNVNPYNVFTGEGFAQLFPATDMWFDNYRLPDQSIVTEETSGSTNIDRYVQRTPSGTSRREVTTETTVSYQETGFEEEVLAYAIPFARQREIFGKVQGLRPNTRYWPFFDKVPVEQWTISETEIEHRAHLTANDHLRGYPEVDVTVKQHPRKSVASDSTLISDYKGDLWFSFWLPNNAPVPSPQANEFNSIEEWETWIDAQRKESTNYANGSKDPSVYDDIGWKFRTGSIDFLLSDVSTGIANDQLSSAHSNYISSGTLNVSQKTIHMTRHTQKDTINWIDPLAQSILIDGREGVPGAFVTKIEVFMRSAPQTSNRGGTDLAIPLQLQLREMDNGVPVAWPAGEQFRVYKPADEVYDVVANISDLEDLDDVLSNPVTFEFPEPVYLEANQEYAVVLLSECDDYTAFVSTTYGLILGKTEERVNKQPATGSLFLSQNGSTWTARQDQNLAYRIYTAKFKQQGTFNLFNDKLPQHNHNTQLLSVPEGDLSRFRVNHLGHNLGVGDKVSLTGLDATGSYLGLDGATIMDSNNVVDSADVAGYFVQLGSSFAEAGWFGADSASTNRGFNFDRATYNVMLREYPRTDVQFTGSFVTGVSHADINTTSVADPRFAFTGNTRKVVPNKELFFGSPNYIGNTDQEVNAIATQGDSSPSVLLGGTFTSSSASTFGGPTAASVASLGYVSDVSPILDLQRSMFVVENYLIDNQPLDSASQSDLNNMPFYYSKETHPTLGSSPSKHITRPVVLGQAANGIKVFVDMFKPSAADFEVYYRTTSDPDEDIYEVPFVLATQQGDVPDSPFTPETFKLDNLKFNEYKYLIGGEDGSLDDFTKFQLKIVMRSTNSSEVPFLKSIRAIALV